MRDLPPIVWLPEAWRALQDDEDECSEEPVSIVIVNRKLDHLLGGVATIIEALASVLEGQVFMQAELQPVLDAINDLATEEGLVANAVKTIVDKVNNGQVVVKADAQVLVDAINGVTENLKSVVGAIPEENPPIGGVESPAPIESEVPPVAGLISVPPAEAANPVPVGPDTSGVVSEGADSAPYMGGAGSVLIPDAAWRDGDAAEPQPTNADGGAIPTPDANSPASVTGPEAATSGISQPVESETSSPASGDAPSELQAPASAPSLD